MYQSDIVFNGVSLSKAIPSANILDITIGAVDISHTVTSRMIGAGSIFGYTHDGSRSITIEVELPFEKSKALSSFRKLASWSKSEQPAEMYLPNQSGRYIKCILASISSLSVREWYNPITLEFVAYEPYFIGKEKVTSIGSQFYVDGDADTGFEIESVITAAVTSPSIAIDGVTAITLSGSVGTGTLVIKSDDKCSTVYLDNSSLMDKVTYGSRFQMLKPGAHTITSTLQGTIKLHERWY